MSSSTRSRSVARLASATFLDYPFSQQTKRRTKSPFDTVAPVVETRFHSSFSFCIFFSPVLVEPLVRREKNSIHIRWRTVKPSKKRKPLRVGDIYSRELFRGSNLSSRVCVFTSTLSLSLYCKHQTETRSITGETTTYS